MAELNDERELLEVLADEFIQRHRGGDCPSVSEYAAQHPELAEEIEELFPAIAAMERLKVHKEESSGARLPLGTPKLERLGDFRILGEIGRGGMGIVFEAFQESLGRHVAVKVLPRQSLLDPKQLQRFQHEAQTAARLHHTNIVPLFGVGEQDGYHYIVMQLIRGVALDAVLSRLRQLPSSVADMRGEAGSPPEAGHTTEAVRLARVLVDGQFWQTGDFGLSSSLVSAGEGSPQPRPAAAATEQFRARRDTEVDGSGDLDGETVEVTAVPVEAPRFGPPYWRSVAAIGMQVADALHYAHVHHTLHRDIKPGNLLLDSQGVVWITDFGLAKAMDEEHASQTGSLAGTLRYMAPEQFSGRMDARSDIYSLGLSLYELLTLRPAFDDSNRSSLIRKITHDEPVRPRKLNPRIPRDLETVVLKAIAREPADRYHSSAELARDLERFLDDRPIQARRVSAVERLWRWSRRNRVVAGLGVSTLMLLILVAIVATTGYVRTRQANIKEAEQRKKAEDTSALAVEALDNIFQQFAPDRMPSMSTPSLLADAGEEITVPVQPVLSKEAAGMLEHMLAFYDRLARQSGDDARLRRKVAEANRRVGDIRQRLGQYEESKTAYSRAIDLYQQLAERSDEDGQLRADIARIQNELGNVLAATGELQEATASYKKALGTLQASPADASASPQHQYELARTYYFLVKRPGRDMGSPPLALGGRMGRRPGPPGFGSEPPGRRGPRGPNSKPGERPGSKEPGDRDKPADPDQPKPPSDSGAPPDSGPPPDRGSPPPGPPPPGPPPGPGSRPGTSAGPGLHFQAMWKEREENLRKAIEILERLIGEHPAVPDYRHLLALCYRELPPRFFGQKPDGTADNREKATEILQKLVEEYPGVPDYRYDLCETYAMPDFRRMVSTEGADGTAQQCFREKLEKALAISEELVAEHPNVPDYAASQIAIRLRLAFLLRETDSAAAEAALRKALDLQSALVRRFPKTSSYKFWLAVIQQSLAGLLQDRGRLPEARKMLETSIATFKGIMESDPKDSPIRFVLAHNYNALAELHRRMGEEPAAAEASRQAEALRPGRNESPRGPKN